MSLTVQQMILDAKKLANRLKERDSSADTLISKSQSVYKLLDAMKQYSEDVNQLNEAARQRPHNLFVANIQQESRHVRFLQRENKELRAALQEHQDALELLMSRYREQINRFAHTSKLNLPELYNKQYIDSMQTLNDKIEEMAAVMKSAAQADEEEQIKSLELITRLKIENQGLRDLLEISTRHNPGNMLLSENSIT